MADPVLKSERDWWEYLHQPTTECTERRNGLDSEFAEMFPQGHETSLREFIVMCGSYLADGMSFQPGTHGARLEQVHPEAFAILAKYGEDYRPKEFEEPPKFGEPAMGGCFSNARVLALMNVEALRRRPEHPDRREMLYVEGVVRGPGTSPMLHAWNTRGLPEQSAIDWTFYATARWTRYFGIGLTLNEFDGLCEIGGRKGRRHPLFEKRWFNPGIKEALVEILENRSRSKAA